MLYCFAFYHIWLVYKNTTTAETFKWGDLKHDVKMANDILNKIKQQKEKKDSGKTSDAALPRSEIYSFRNELTWTLKKRLYVLTGVDVDEFFLEKKEAKQTKEEENEELTTTRSHGNNEGRRNPQQPPATTTGAKPSETTKKAAPVISEAKLNELFLEELRRLQRIKLKNTYNKGWRLNFREVLFPASEARYNSLRKLKKNQ